MGQEPGDYPVHRLLQDAPAGAHDQQPLVPHQVPVVHRAGGLRQVHAGHVVPYLVDEPDVDVHPAAGQVAEVHAGRPQHLEPGHLAAALRQQGGLGPPVGLRPPAVVPGGQDAPPEGPGVRRAHGDAVQVRPLVGGGEHLRGLRQVNCGGPGDPALHEGALDPVQGDAAGVVHRPVYRVEHPRPLPDVVVRVGLLRHDGVVGEMLPDAIDDGQLRRPVRAGDHVVDPGVGGLLGRRPVPSQYPVGGPPEGLGEYVQLPHAISTCCRRSCWSSSRSWAGTPGSPPSGSR